MSSLKDESYFAKDAEGAIVAALFSDSDTAVEAYDRVAVTLRVTDFFTRSARAAFEAFAALTEAGHRPDSVTLAGYIRSSPEFNDELRGELAAATATPFALNNIEAYAEAVLEKSKSRQIKARLATLTDRTALIGGALASRDILREVDAVSMEFDERRDEVQLLQSPLELLQKTIARLDDLQNETIKGLSYGLSRLDEALGPMLPGDLIVVAGRPGMGKSVLLSSIAVDNNVRARPEGDDGLFALFSLEMGTEKLGFRLLSNIGKINHDHLRKAKIDNREWDQLSYAFKKYEESDIHVDTDPTLTPAMIRSKCRMLERKTGKKIKGIGVDYLQLMDVDAGTGRKNDNRNAEITVISRNLKKIAKEFNCPVIALSQLNRSVESRADKRPQMSDLRESGAIEQDADVIILLYRDEYYNSESDAVGIAEVIAAKARDGGGGTYPVQFIGEHQRFANLNTDSYSYDASFGSEK